MTWYSRVLAVLCISALIFLSSCASLVEMKDFECRGNLGIASDSASTCSNYQIQRAKLISKSDTIRADRNSAFWIGVVGTPLTLGALVAAGATMSDESAEQPGKGISAVTLVILPWFLIAEFLHIAVYMEEGDKINAINREYDLLRTCAVLGSKKCVKGD